MRADPQVHLGECVEAVRLVEVDEDPELVEALFEAEYQAVVRSGAILLLPGWEDSRGTRVELRLALSVGLDIIVDKGGAL